MSTAIARSWSGAASPSTSHLTISAAASPYSASSTPGSAANGLKAASSPRELRTKLCTSRWLRMR